jgi:hypothetical protein
MEASDNGPGGVLQQCLDILHVQQFRISLFSHSHLSRPSTPSIPTKVHSLGSEREGEVPKKHIHHLPMFAESTEQEIGSGRE